MLGALYLFEPTTNHVYGQVLSHPFYSPLIIYFLDKENSQDVSAGWHEWMPTVLADLLKISFLLENYTYGLE